ncbi:4713_t:CDS:2 [Gigaspora margarita]|uniref:4713_t:CDS:1 n=1 Tax=Gigaspora margarita TaxID=4874 RepID=A0ABN7UNM1_GIGMA|nr:4713_t:CDS:2 [Gigaspora margarita]
MGIKVKMESLNICNISESHATEIPLDIMKKIIAKKDETMTFK